MEISFLEKKIWSNPKIVLPRISIVQPVDAVSTSVHVANSMRVTNMASSIPSVPFLTSLEAGSPTEVGKVQVDGEAAESVIAEKRIGERIKCLRLKKSMGLVDLGRHTGLSASFLSQLETGRVVPTLRNLARIAMVFSKDLSYFFDPEPQTLFRVHRRRDRVRLPQTGVDDPSYFFESLGYQVPDRQLDPYFAEFLPVKKGRMPRAHQHAGCEFLYLLSGALDVRHGETTHHIEAGDAIYFDANTIHNYCCSGKSAATAVIVTLQHPLMAQLGSGGARVSSSNGRSRQLAETIPPPAAVTAKKNSARMQ
jgi:transcriptional regulator with XRE-family HTH domain